MTNNQRILKVETIEQFLLRGGKIQQCKPSRRGKPRSALSSKVLKAFYEKQKQSF